MATLNRRLQVLLDEERFARLEQRAEREGTTVARLVRHALDRAYPASSPPADVAADRFLARPPLDLGSWDEAKGDIEDSFGRSVRP